MEIRLKGEYLLQTKENNKIMAKISLDPASLLEQLKAQKVVVWTPYEDGSVSIHFPAPQDTGVRCITCKFGKTCLPQKNAWNCKDYISVSQEQEKVELPEEIDLSKYNSHCDSNLLVERVNQLIRFLRGKEKK